MLVSIILQSYLLVLISITLISVLLFVFGLRLIFKRAQTKPTKQQIHSQKVETNRSEQKSSFTITSGDINAIAGEDALSTQLDLARAYIETGRKQLAKKILLYVAKQGNDTQQKEAKELLSFI